MSLVIFHPSVAPFVQQAARALEEAGQLDRFVTTVRDNPSNPVQASACTVAGLFGRDLRRQFARRAVTEIPASKVESRPWAELLRLAVGAVDRDGRLTDFVWERAEASFDRGVARSLRTGLTGVYGYEHSCRLTFARARQLGLSTVYDVPAPESRHVQALLEAEMAKFPELKSAYHHYTAKREESRIAHRRAEWESADLVITASKFTLQSYADSGLDVSKARVIAYGAPPPAPREQVLENRPSDAKLNFIWAGTFGVRKGAHLLLEAWTKGQFGRHARLRVFGSVTLPDRALKPLPEGIELRGPISRTELMKEYRMSDALVFPTLCDGFGMVATEAWASGLPVITTQRAGAADLLSHGKNGLLIPAGDAAAIADALTWCLSNRNELRTMREASLATASGWQWSDYRRGLAEALSKAGFWGSS